MRSTGAGDGRAACGPSRAPPRLPLAAADPMLRVTKRGEAKAGRRGGDVPQERLQQPLVQPRVGLRVTDEHDRERVLMAVVARRSALQARDQLATGRLIKVELPRMAGAQHPDYTQTRASTRRLRRSRRRIRLTFE